MIIAEADESARETLNNNAGRTAGICETFGIGSIGAHRFQLIAVTRLDGDCESFIRAHFWTRRIRAVAANEFVYTPAQLLRARDQEHDLAFRRMRGVMCEKVRRRAAAEFLKCFCQLARDAKLPVWHNLDASLKRFYEPIRRFEED